MYNKTLIKAGRELEQLIKYFKVSDREPVLTNEETDILNKTYSRLLSDKPTNL